MRTIRTSKGFTLMELVVGMGISTLVVLGIARFGALPTFMMKSLSTGTLTQIPVKALDIVVDDLKQAESSSFPSDQLDPASGGALAWFKTYNLEATPPVRYIRYQFQANDNSSSIGRLIRCVNDLEPSVTNATCTSILSDVIQPDAATPLFRIDPAYPHLIVVRLLYRPFATGHPIKVMRRAGLRT